MSLQLQLAALLGQFFLLCPLGVLILLPFYYKREREKVEELVKVFLDYFCWGRMDNLFGKTLKEKVGCSPVGLLCTGRSPRIVLLSSLEPGFE